MNTIKEEWKEYEKMTMSKAAGEIQRKETKQAFYAGALTVLGTLNTIAESGESDEDSMLSLENMMAECKDLIEELVDAGKVTVDKPTSNDTVIPKHFH